MPVNISDIPDHLVSKEKRLVFEPITEWHKIELDKIGVPAKIPSEEIKQELKQKAYNLLRRENEAYAFTQKDRYGNEFRTKVLQTGTASDRLSATILAIQESPLHAMSHFDRLTVMLQSKNRTAFLQSISTTKDLLITTLLPNRKLKALLEQSSLGHRNMNTGHLIHWAFEDHLKQFYFQMIQIFEHLSHDPLVFVRNHLVSHFEELLREKPEQEQNLLKLLVDRLGDTDRNIASKASFYILQIEDSHPGMRRIISKDIERLFFTDQDHPHAQYYSIVTLNQTVLTKQDKELSEYLLEFYISAFTYVLNGGGSQGTQRSQTDLTKLSKKKRMKKVAKRKRHDRHVADAALDESRSKILSGLLTGVNRAFPFVDQQNNKLLHSMETLYKITNGSSFATAIQALMLIFQIAGANAVRCAFKISFNDANVQGVQKSLLSNSI